MAARVLTALVVALVLALAPAAGADYRPSGPIVADSGFRPDPDGYSFANYGKGGQNLSAAEMVRLFGREVCEEPSGRCRLTTVARGWMATVNKSMEGGHCMGFAVTAQLLHAGLGTPASPLELGGSESVFGLRRSARVARQIAYGWAFQTLPGVQARSEHVDARRLITRLREILPARDETYTLGIFKRDQSGGHAITPFALEDRGAGRYAVLVYDNNYPGETRALHVDVRANTWRYQAAPNPRLRAGLYDGDGRVSNLELMPATAGLGEHDCYFCHGGAAAPQGKRKLTLVWSGDPDTHEHGDLVIRDRQGRRSGCGDFGDGYQCRNRIPGVEQEALFFGGEDVWLQSAHPSYRLPYGRGYSISLTGGQLRRPAREGFGLVGKRRFVGVADVSLQPGERDTLRVSPGARRVTFVNDPHQVETPRLQLGVETANASYLFQLKARRVERGAAIGFRLDPRRRRVLILGEDVRKTGRYQITAMRSDARGRTVRRRAVVLRSGDVVEIRYGALLPPSPRRR